VSEAASAWTTPRLRAEPLDVARRRLSTWQALQRADRALDLASSALVSASAVSSSPRSSVPAPGVDAKSEPDEKASSARG